MIQTTASESTFVCLLAGRSQNLLLLNFHTTFSRFILTVFSFNWASFRTEAIKRFQVKGLVKKKTFFGNFSQYGREGSPESQNFCNFAKTFLACQIHS